VGGQFFPIINIMKVVSPPLFFNKYKKNL
jgi:hypothetical protein